MRGQLHLVAIVLAVFLPRVASAGDINAEFDCGYGEIPVGGELELAWVTADVMPLSTKVLARSRAETFISGTITTTEYISHYGRCPIVKDECEPGERVAAGMAVPIWKRQGQFACATFGTPYSGQSGWVHQDHLRLIEKDEPLQPQWIGTYTRGGFDEVAISGKPGGGLLISGAVIAAAGEGPGFSFYEVNQIDLSEFEPKGRSGALPPAQRLEVMSRKDGETWSKKGSAPSVCHLTLRLRGPFLVIKEAPECLEDQRTGFEGIWAKKDGEAHEAHQDHAKTIQLGR